MRARFGTLAVLVAAAGLLAWAFIPSSNGGSARDPGPVRSLTGDPALFTTSPAGALSAGISPTRGPVAVFGPTLSVSLSTRTAGQPMRPGFVGLSLEYFTLPTYLGHDPAHLDPVFLALVRGVAPGQAPILRIGGNSTDRTWWPVRGLRGVRGVDFALSGRWLALARSLAIRTRGRLILGVNLAAGNRRLARVEADHLVAGIGSRHIAALEIGNEPDDYPVIPWYRTGTRRTFARPSSYGVEAYVRQFTSWEAALPRVELAGPALARTQWMPAALYALLRPPAGRRVGLVTFHRYPLRNCETNPRAADYPTIRRLLSDASSAGLTARVAPFVATAHASGRQFRVDELNSVSCQGKLGVSNTFASALWVLDTLFDLSAAGVDGVNLHMLPGSAYQAFSVSHDRGSWKATVAPVYYGMLMFARAFPPGARLVQLSAASGSVKAWATQSPDGHLRVVLINENPAQPVAVHLQVPGSPVPLRTQRLLAPSVSASTGVSLGGETFGPSTSTGALPANPRLPELDASQGYYSLWLPAASAVLLTR